ncbi:MAG: hypothetical protein ACXW3E_11550 [Thermoanaerobaculia bacterium]
MKRDLLALGLLFLAVSASGQATPEKPQYFLIHEEMAKPSMLQQYEGASRDILATFKEKSADPKVFNANVFSTTEFQYIYVVPIANWGGLDVFQQSWMALSQTVGKDRWQSLMTRSNNAMWAYNEFVIVRRPDLSYTPANPRLKPEEQPFVHLQFYYLDAARSEESEQIAKDYVALFKAKNISDGFSVYQVLSGNDLPMLIASSRAKSAADYYANDEKVNATLGADVRALQARALAITRKFEVRDAMYRPELSYPGPAAATSK